MTQGISGRDRVNGLGGALLLFALRQVLWKVFLYNYHFKKY